MAGCPSCEGASLRNEYWAVCILNGMQNGVTHDAANEDVTNAVSHYDKIIIIFLCVWQKSFAWRALDNGLINRETVLTAVVRSIGY